MTVLLEFLTALLEYLDLFNGIVQSADFPTVKALYSPQIIPDSHTYLLFPKLCRHNRRIPNLYQESLQTQCKANACNTIVILS